MSNLAKTLVNQPILEATYSVKSRLGVGMGSDCVKSRSEKMPSKRLNDNPRTMRPVNDCEYGLDFAKSARENDCEGLIVRKSYDDSEVEDCGDCDEAGC